MFIRLIKHPLFLFTFIAGSLFFVDALRDYEASELIEVSKADYQNIMAEAARFKGRDLSEQEKEAALASHINDEILLKEAYRLGLDNDDVIRKRLLNKLRFILSADIPDPDESTLRTYHQTHRNSFLQPNSWDIEQVFFQHDQSIPSDIESKLQNSFFSKGTQNTPRFPYKLSSLTEGQIAARFGQHVLASIKQATLQQWYGPIESPQGVHFINVLKKIDGKPDIFENVRQHVRNAWRKDQESTRQHVRINTLKSNYRIVFDET